MVSMLRYFERPFFFLLDISEFILTDYIHVESVMLQLQNLNNLP